MTGTSALETANHVCDELRCGRCLNFTYGKRHLFEIPQTFDSVLERLSVVAPTASMATMSLRLCFPVYSGSSRDWQGTFRISRTEQCFLRGSIVLLEVAIAVVRSQKLTHHYVSFTTQFLEEKVDLTSICANFALVC